MKKNSVVQHYDASAENYHLQYERDFFLDLTRTYPANYFRLQLLLKSFIEKDVKSVVEVGVGEGTPLVTLANAGIEVAGFDISKKMVDKCQQNLKKNKLSDRKIIWGDIQDPVTYSPLLSDGQFDALLAMGVMPHVRNDDFTLNNMKSMVKSGGHVFIEFRNKLFSLFTFNRYTLEFIMDDLLRGVSAKIKDIVCTDLKARLEMDKPEKRLKTESKNLVDINKNTDAPGYDAILSKFHNPFEVLTQFERLGFEEAKLFWYHYHPAMPFLQNIHLY